VSAGSTTDTRYVGGLMSLKTGGGSASSSGLMSLSTADAISEGASGWLSLSSGSAASGASGAVSVLSGASTSANAGSIVVQAGNAGTSGNGGSISLRPGTGVSADGNVVLHNAAGNAFITISSTALSLAATSATASLTATNDITITSSTGAVSLEARGILSVITSGGAFVTSSILIRPGTSTSAAGGDLSLIAASSTTLGGDVVIYEGQDTVGSNEGTITIGRQGNTIRGFNRATLALSGQFSGVASVTSGTCASGSLDLSGTFPAWTAPSTNDVIFATGDFVHDGGATEGYSITVIYSGAGTTFTFKFCNWGATTLTSHQGSSGNIYITAILS
jgi:hypothetical protein